MVCQCQAWFSFYRSGRGLVYWMAAYGLGRAPHPGVGGCSGECVLFVRLGGTRSLFTRLRLKMREEGKRRGWLL